MTQPNIAKFGMVAVAALTLPAVSFAGHTAPGKETKTVVEKVHESCISGSLGIDIVSQYIARGLPQENQGAILQPYVDLSFRVYEGSGFLTKLTVDLGFWNSFHSRKTAAGGVFGGGGASTRAWYESDFTAGLSFYLGEHLVLSPYYRAYMSPNDAFSTAHTAGLRLAYNDGGMLGGWSLNPYALVQFDLENATGNGGSNDGVYYEVGISPGTAFGPIGFSIPIKAGFGSNDYYFDDETFGYLSVGVNLEYGLDFIPECLGDWSLRGYATWYLLGDAAEIHNVPAIRDEEDNEWVFGGGLRVTF
jgi:hypothetical protein